MVKNGKIITKTWTFDMTLDFTGEERRGAKGPSAYSYLHDPSNYQLDTIFTL
jgi:hypothetical protein